MMSSFWDGNCVRVWKKSANWSNGKSVPEILLRCYLELIFSWLVGNPHIIFPLKIVTYYTCYTLVWNHIHVQQQKLPEPEFQPQPRIENGHRAPGCGKNVMLREFHDLSIKYTTETYWNLTWIQTIAMFEREYLFPQTIMVSIHVKFPGCTFCIPIHTFIFFCVVCLHRRYHPSLPASQISNKSATCSSLKQSQQASQSMISTLSVLWCYGWSTYPSTYPHQK